MRLTSPDDPGFQHGSNKRPMGIQVALLLTLGLALVGGARQATAQSIVRGDLVGVVSELGGEPLFAVAVTAVEAGGGAPRLLETDRAGRFSVPLLRAGEYEILAEALGFIPKVVRGVQVTAGQTATVFIELEAAPPPVQSIDTVFAGGGASARFDGLGSHWISQAQISAFPDPTMALEGLASLSPMMDESLGSEGLPGSSTAVFWDGVPFTPAQHPASRAGVALPILPRIGLANVDVHRRSDVEWSGGAGGYVAAISRAASPESVGELYAAGSAGPLWQADSFSGLSSPEATSAWGGGTYSFPFPSGNARLFVGVEGQRAQTPRLSPFSTELAERLVSARPPAAGVAASDLTEPFVSTLQALSGLARLDWTGGPTTELSARVGFSTVSSEGGDFFSPGLEYGSTAPLDASDATAAVTLLSAVSERATLEIRVGLEHSSREWSGTLGGSDLSSVRATLFSGTGTRLGTSPALAGKVSRSAVVGSPLVHLALSEQHALKFGFTFSVPSYEYRYIHGSGGDFVFDRPEDILSGQGAFSQAAGGPPARSFNVPEWGLVVQHLWEPRPGVRITTGFRHDEEKLPIDEVPVALLVEFRELTGLDLTAFTSDLRKTSPRFAVELDPSGSGRTVIEAAISATYDQMDPAALNDAISLTGAVDVRRQLGGLGQWPALPSPTTVSATIAPMMAVFGPDLKAPRTARASLGLSQALGSSSTLHLIGTVRRTEFLVRRSDVNLAVVPASLDTASDRPIYGTLRKIGSLVVPEPGSNRRFAEHDIILGLSSDGWSDYRGITVAFERGSGGPFDVFASYTLSSTEDNLVGARSGDPMAELVPRVESVPSSPWEHGTSDFDVPHRLSAGFRTRFPLLEGAELSATYRFQSGSPYTPGYRAGVDVNGDGSGSNDPAFVPQDAVSADLLDAACLSSDLGRVATRNSCRAPGLHSLDARLSVALFRFGGATGSLTLDLFNLLDVDLSTPDSALLLIEEGSPLAEGSGTTSIPTRVNPTFGQQTHPLQPGRMLRVGFRIGPP